MKHLSLALTILVTCLARTAQAEAVSNVPHRVERLDALVHLSATQKAQVSEAFAREEAALSTMAPGKERMTEGADFRQATRVRVRSVLTPEQRRKYDISPQSLGGGLPTDPANLVMRLDQVATLTADQKTKATQIIWDDLTDQLAALPDDQPLKGFMWGDKVRDQLRAILTPAQQAKFDSTPPYRKNNRPAAR
jgi:hypothetical protein